MIKKKSLKTPKEQSESVYRRRTENKIIFNSTEIQQFHRKGIQIIEKPVGAMNNKESSDIGHIGEIRKRKTKQKINKDK
jgi:hypothetical protein